MRVHTFKMKTSSTAPFIEVLETRIAPALFFLSGTAQAVFNSAGTDVTAAVNDAATATAAGADIAVKLKAGDSLILDINDNRRLDVGEVVLVRIVSGSAEIFAADLDAGGSFGADEITGMIVSDRFNAAVKGDIHGSIVTALPAGAVAPDLAVLLPSSIAGLAVSGRVTGHILAGGSISNVNIGAGSSDPGWSAESICTGTGASGAPASYDGVGVTIHAPTFTPIADKAGGTITNLVLAHGVTAIFSSDGGASQTKTGGAGGGITRVVIADSLVKTDILAGKGGNSTAPKSIGGAGGAIAGVSANFHIDGGAAETMTVKSGSGGDGNSGGHAGAVSSVTLAFKSGSPLLIVDVASGNGGAAALGLQTGSGGNGGAFSRLTVKAYSDLTKTALDLAAASIHAGSGGAGVRGGAGGSVIGATIIQADGDLGPTIAAGPGGDGTGTSAGAGGALSSILVAAGDAVAAGQFSAGAGGFGNGSAVGGNGGAVSHFTATLGSASGTQTQARLDLHAGDGGDGLRGGTGGAMSAVNLITGAVASVVSIHSGNGGDGDAGVGGNGGAASSVSLTFNGPVAGEAAIASGQGGSVVTTNANGGAAGALSGVTVNVGASGSVGGALIILAARGGAGQGTGAGGNGGNIYATTIKNFGTLDTLIINGGDGGDAGATGARGGYGGYVARTSVTSADAIPGAIFIHGGSGAPSGFAANSRGGSAGNIAGIVFDALSSDARLGAAAAFVSAAGASGAGSIGGNGGNISGITGKLRALDAVAPAGGAGDARGGIGGSLSSINLSAVGDFIHLLAAGQGGGSAGIAGKGGSIAGVITPGDIGDFTQPFNASPNVSGLGGLFAGQGGEKSGVVQTALNGSVSSIRAGRIAAILAGLPAADALTGANAAVRISAITAATIGTAFTFTDNTAGPNPSNGQFLLGDGDTALGGLVIVKAGGFIHATVPGLKLVEVT